MQAATQPPLVIPFFIAHEGCPHRCAFCNQHTIAGETGRVTAEVVCETIGRELGRPRAPGREVQVAFYGGSFTGVARSRQEELLEAVQPFLEQGQVSRVRISTRPDCVDEETAAFLRRRGVGIVELGVQSMTDAVLEQSGRGHTAASAAAACGLLQAAGIRVGGQLMLGLPGETARSQLAGVRRLLALRPDFLRLYPALVLRGTRLAELQAAGEYRPLSLERAVALAARIKDLCDRQAVRVVRMGLQPSASLKKEVVAGPYHPAFGELVLSRMLFRAARKLLATARGKGQICVAAADESIFRGPGNINLKRLQRLGLLPGKDGFRLCPDQPRQTLRLG